MRRKLFRTLLTILLSFAVLHSLKNDILVLHALTNATKPQDSDIGSLPETDSNKEEPTRSSVTRRKLMVDETVPRGQSFFYTTSESRRLSSFEVWRPKQLVGRYLERKSEDLSTDKIFVSMQTTFSSMWSTVPIQLLTTFQDFPSFGIYSNTPDSIAGVEVVNVFEPISEQVMKEIPDFEPYQILMSIRDSHVFVPPDQASIPGLPKMAKYQLLPMVLQTYQQHPDYDWYVFVRDQTTLLTKNLHEFLHNLDSSKPYYLGRGIRSRDINFAGLDSAIVISQGLMQKMFSSSNSEAQKLSDSIYDEYTRKTQDECCGDYMLAKFLKQECDVELDLKTSSSFFQANSLETIKVRASNWCSPIGSFGNQRPRDIELTAEYQGVKSASPLLFSDIYLDFIKPYLEPEPQQNWDNGADDIQFGPRHDHSTDAHKSQLNCRTACYNVPQCLMFRYDDYTQYCGLGISSIALGGPILRYESSRNEELCDKFQVQCNNRKPDQSMTSEWLVDRIREMRRTLECDSLSADILSEGVEHGALDQVEGWWHRAKHSADQLTII